MLSRYRIKAELTETGLAGIVYTRPKYNNNDDDDNSNNNNDIDDDGNDYSIFMVPHHMRAQGA